MEAVIMLPLYSFSFTLPVTFSWVLSAKALRASRRGVNHLPLYTRSAKSTASLLFMWAVSLSMVIISRHWWAL